MGKLALINNLKSTAIMAKAVLKNHAPEILMVTGCVGFVGTVVSASKATLKAQEVLGEHHDMKSDIEICRATQTEEDYSDSDYKKDIITAYSKTTFGMVKTYAPTVALGTLTVACFLTAYGILKKRNLALIAAYNALNESFNLYRSRVIEDKGAEADAYYMTGKKTDTITVTDEAGNKEKKKIIKGDVNLASPYSFKFSKYKENGERNWQWNEEANLNRMYLDGQQDYLTDLLYTRCQFNRNHEVIRRGSVLLNEVRDLLGEDFTETGSVVGWRFSNGEPGCNGYIQFNIVEGTEEDKDTGKMIPCYYINPNVDGLIYDLIGQKEEVPFKANFVKD